MPIYQYECTDCHNQFEQFQKFSDDPLTTCPTCSGTVRRVIQNVGVVFKGSGWYITDSRGSSNESRGSTSEKSSAETSTTDKPASESTAAAKPEKASKAEPAANSTPAAAT